MEDTYSLIDSGNGRKLEKFGKYVLDRPSAQAIWKPVLSQNVWAQADGVFTREDTCRWLKPIDGPWEVSILGIRFKLHSTDFGHLGVFPEQREQWEWVRQKTRRNTKVLNLFAYSGGATLVAAREGATVCHLDASKKMVAWARENAQLNGQEGLAIRWIVEDVVKFLQREIKRKKTYDGIILDPPTFGRGSKGEVFKFEEDLFDVLKLCRKLLSGNPSYVLLSCHTPNITQTGLYNILQQVMRDFGGTLECGEMMLEGKGGVFPLPNGTFARWSP